MAIVLDFVIRLLKQKFSENILAHNFFRNRVENAGNVRKFSEMFEVFEYNPVHAKMTQAFYRHLTAVNLRSFKNSYFLKIFVFSEINLR